MSKLLFNRVWMLGSIGKWKAMTVLLFLFLRETRAFLNRDAKCAVEKERWKMQGKWRPLRKREEMKHKDVAV